MLKNQTILFIYLSSSVKGISIKLGNSGIDISSANSTGSIIAFSNSIWKIC